MTIDWFHFVFALLLLWLPRQVLRSGAQFFRRTHRSRRAGSRDTNPAKTRESGDPSVSFRLEFAKLRNYIDLLRAGLASVALTGWMPGLAPALSATDGAPAATVNLVVYARLLIVMIGVLIQSFRFEVRPTLFPPIFYLTGLSIGMCSPTVALFAFVLIWTFNLALPNPTAFLSVYALLLAAFTMLFLGLGRTVPYAMAGLCFLPALLSLLIRRPLVLFAKKTKPASSISAS